MTPRSVEEYRACAGPEAVDRLRRAAAPLRGCRVLHVNSTPRGGGVAEILRSAVPLLRDLGLDCDWRVVSASPRFFEVTKGIHNRLQGARGRMTLEEKRVWREAQEENAAALPTGYDVGVVHDPQPLGLPEYAPAAARHWVWRLHIDSSRPNPGAWSFLRRFLGPYEALVFTLPEFVPPGIPRDLVRIEAPAIDPLVPKNRPMSAGLARAAVRNLGIDVGRPLVAQVARLDPWKDPLGVIDAYRMVRREHGGVQLALLGAIEAADDPEAYRLAAAVRAHAGADPDIHVFTDPNVIGWRQVGAVQLVSDVIFQKSVREGFGLSVAEALWKATPVIGGRAGGIPLQLQDGVGGFLVTSVDEAAERCAWLLAHPAEAGAIADAGRAQVATRFLLPRLLEDELALYAETLAGVRRRDAALAERVA